MSNNCNSGVIQVEPGGDLPISDDEDVSHPGGVSLHGAQRIAELLVVLKSAGWDIFILLGLEGKGEFSRLRLKRILLLIMNSWMRRPVLPVRRRRGPRTSSRGWWLTLSRPGSGSSSPAGPDRRNPAGFSAGEERCWPQSITPTVGPKNENQIRKLTPDSLDSNYRHSAQLSVKLLRYF